MLRALDVEVDLHQDRVGARVGHVVGDDPVLPARRRARDPAGHAAAVQRPDRRGHVPRLEIREGRAVGDDVLERLDVRVVDRRVVDVAQHAVRDREPHLRRRVARGAQAVLAREVEVGQRARPVRGDAQRRSPGARSDPENDARHGGDCETGQPPWWRQAAHRSDRDAIPADASSSTAYLPQPAEAAGVSTAGSRQGARSREPPAAAFARDTRRC